MFNTVPVANLLSLKQALLQTSMSHVYVQSILPYHNRLINIHLLRHCVFLCSYLSLCWSLCLCLLLLFLSFCLSRSAMTINLESSVSAPETITPSALTWMLTTPSMPISERVYNMCACETLSSQPHSFHSFTTSLTLMYFNQF